MVLVEYAKSELDRIEKDGDGFQDMINNDILEIIKLFASQHHSGSSAAYTIAMLQRLLNFKPISPLTGAEDEWGTEVCSDQNKRCSSIFRKPDGKIIDIDGIVVSDDGGNTWFSSGEFRKEVTFPYFPPDKPEKVYIEYIGDTYDIITNDPERIKALYERKRKEFDEPAKEH